MLTLLAGSLVQKKGLSLTAGCRTRRTAAAGGGGPLPGKGSLPLGGGGGAPEHITRPWESEKLSMEMVL